MNGNHSQDAIFSLHCETGIVRNIRNTYVHSALEELRSVEKVRVPSWLQLWRFWTATWQAPSRARAPPRPGPCSRLLTRAPPVPPGGGDLRLRRRCDSLTWEENEDTLLLTGKTSPTATRASSCRAE